MSEDTLTQEVPEVKTPQSPDESGTTTVSTPQFPGVPVPAAPGWKAAFTAPDGVLKTMDIAFWLFAPEGTAGVLGTVGGLVTVQEVGGFIGYMGPSDSIDNWAQTAMGLSQIHGTAPAGIQEKLASLAASKATQPEDDRLRLYTGTISGHAESGAIQVFPDGGGPVQEHKDFGVAAGTDLRAGSRVTVFKTPGGLLIGTEVS